MNDAFAKFINGGHPFTKYFELDGNRIVYCANLAIDAVPIRDKQVYLIERRDGRGWATPGGHIDEGETPTDAAHRELQEETLIKQGQYTLSPLSDKVRGEDNREVNVFVWPFRATVHQNIKMGFADDAVGGNWFEPINIPQLAFAHQQKFIQMALADV
jgi:8-oxo-dGTP pyrophosphatase MutT (NUDIX family)